MKDDLGVDDEDVVHRTAGIREAARLGFTGQSITKVWIAERVGKRAS